MNIEIDEKTRTVCEFLIWLEDLDVAERLSIVGRMAATVVLQAGLPEEAIAPLIENEYQSIEEAIKTLENVPSSPPN